MSFWTGLKWFAYGVAFGALVVAFTNVVIAQPKPRCFNVDLQIAPLKVGSGSWDGYHSYTARVNGVACEQQ